jgi:KUP system potassium uptake protein
MDFHMQKLEKSHKNNNKLFTLALGALGVVYGDLGTSPLYALQITLTGVPVTTGNVYGVLSLVFWSLILVISTCYVTVFLRANNEGEGGVLALLSLLKRKNKHVSRWLFIIGIIGAGLLLGDGMITPAISVISAMEGLKVILPDFSHLVVPISFGILFVLFICQHYGTAKISFIFGPIILLWFLTIGVLGGIAIYQHPTVLHALNPWYAIHFFYRGGWHTYLLLGGIFLTITGAEAMYADLGHFGKNPIRIGWFAVALPTLLLNYFGQGAHLLETPDAISNLFYTLAPTWFSIPLLILATIATIIASQAVITASFSLTRQAILLNVSPRLEIIHTSEEETGQVYLPKINFLLAIGTLSLVLIFRSSSGLAAAFGMAVNLVMLIVAILVTCVARQSWKWSIPKILVVIAPVILIDLLFLGANLHKIYEGAWIPLAFATVISIVMVTWEKGVELLRAGFYAEKIALPDIIKSLDHSKLNYLEDLTTIFITDPDDNSGGSFLNYIKLNRILPKEVLIVSIVIENYPFVADDKCFELSKLTKGVYNLNLHYGFMQAINIPKTLTLGEKMKVFPFTLDTDKATFLVEMINIVITKQKYPHLFYWQKRLFSFLLHNSAMDIEFFHLPYNRTIAIGTYCEI